MATELDDNDLDDELDDGSPEPVTKDPAPPADDLRAAMAELAGTVKTLATPKVEKEPELTQEQKNELWAVYDPKKSKPDFMRKFFRMNPDATPDEEKEAEDLFKDMQQGLMKQAVTGARNLMQIELAKRDEKISKMEEYIAQQTSTQTRQRFVEDYPVFADKRYAKILGIAANDVKNQNFNSESEFFKAVAEAAAEYVKGIDASFDLSSQTKTKPNAGTSPRLPRTSVGGTGGTGGGKQGALSVKGDATDEFLED